MAQGENLLFWCTAAFYLLASLGFLGSVIFRRAAWLKWALGSMLLGFAGHNAVIIIRWVATGHPPIIGDYENALAGSWLIVLLFLLVQLRFGNLRPLGIAVAPFVLLMLGWGMATSPVLDPLTPPFRSFWIFVHVIFAWFSYSSYVLAAGFAVLFLIKVRRPDTANEAFFDRFPVPGVLDEMSYRFITFGFVTGTVMLASGSIWANSLWGSYWSWDPIETWSLVSWLIYGLYLHLRIVHGWQAKRAAWLAIAALPTVIMSFFGISWLSEGLHIF